MATEQTKGIFGSAVNVEPPQPAFNTDVSLENTIRNNFPEYQGVNPFALRQTLINDNEAFLKVSDGIFRTTVTDADKEKYDADPAILQKDITRFRESFRKRLNDSAHQGKSSKDTLIDRKIALTQDPEDISVPHYLNVMKANQKKYQEMGLLDDNGQPTFNDSELFARQILSNKDSLRILEEDSYQEFEKELAKAHNDVPDIYTNETMLTEAYVAFKEYGPEGITRYVNQYQQDPESEKQPEGTEGLGLEKSVKDFVSATSKLPELTFTPRTPRPELAFPIPKDLNDYTAAAYSFDGKQFKRRSPEEIIASFKTNLPETFRDMDTSDILELGPADKNYGKLAFSIYETAVNENGYTIDDLINTVLVSSPVKQIEDEKVFWAVDFPSLTPEQKLAFNALQFHSASKLMFQKKSDRIYHFRPNRMQEEHDRKMRIRNWFFNTETIPERQEDGTIKFNEVAEKGFFPQIQNSIATVGMGGADWLDRFFYEPAVRATNKLYEVAGLENQASEAFLDQKQGRLAVSPADLTTFKEDGIVPATIGAATPFVQYMAAMFTLGRFGVATTAKTMQALTSAKKVVDGARFTGLMRWSRRINLMGKKIESALKSKEAWVNNFGTLYTGGALTEISQPESVSFYNVVPQLFGNEPTNNISELYKTSSDLTQAAMDAGASLVLDSLFDTIIASARFGISKSAQAMGRKEFKSVTFNGGKFEVTDAPQFKHEARVFWHNLTKGLASMEQGELGESMAKNFLKSDAEINTLHDVARVFLDETSPLVSGIKNDIEAQVRSIQKELGQGIELSDTQVKTMVEEQYDTFMNKMADQMYGVLSTADEVNPANLVNRFAQTLEEQAPVIREYREGGRFVSPSEIFRVVKENPTQRFVAKNGRIYEVESTLWTVDLSKKLRDTVILRSDEAIEKAELAKRGISMTDEVLNENQIKQLADFVENPGITKLSDEFKAKAVQNNFVRSASLTVNRIKSWASELAQARKMKDELPFCN